MEQPDLGGFGEWRMLARGGLTEVWEARQLSLNRLVAIKVFPAESEEGDRRFLREIAAAGELSDHPAIVTAHDAGILPDDRPYLVMKLCSGGSLARRLELDDRPGVEQVRQFGVRLAAGLAAVHGHGLLHRDIRPANILLDSYGNPGLADFGMAGTPDVSAAADAAPISAYAPPESSTRQPATESADVFSLAATLYALLAGGPPRRPEHGPPVATRPVEPAGAVVTPPGVDRYVMNVLLAALSEDPTARPTAATLRDRLATVPAPRDRVVAAEPEPEPLRGGSGVPATEATRGHGKRPGTVLAMVAALVAGVVSVALWLGAEPDTPGASAAASQGAVPGDQPPGADASPVPGRQPTPPAGTTAVPGSAGDTTIRLQDPVAAARPFQTVLIQGLYTGGAETLLRVQRWEEGSWLAFPIPTKTDRSGRFTAYVELGKPGRYRLRVLDPDSGVTSEPAVLLIK